MTALDALLRPGHPSGVVQAHVDPTPQLRAAGWSVAHVRATTKDGLLNGAGEALHLPAHYGHNLDALLDCLRELRQTTALVWAGWREFAAAHPRSWATVSDVFELRVEERPGFALILLG